MNERIRELAEQAGYLPDMFGIGHWDMPECKKFAELVIQECIKIMHTNERIPEGFFYAKPAHVHELVIKQHFGIDNE
jgi:hypothetical protein